MRPVFKPRVYLSARISPDAHTINNIIANALSTHFDVFKPHEHQVCNGDHTLIGREAYETDTNAMEQSEVCFLIPPYGRDCAFEIGWFDARSIPIFVYVDDQIDWLRDAMLKASFDTVFTDNDLTYWTLKTDPILSDRVIKIKDRSELGQCVMEIYSKGLDYANL